MYKGITFVSLIALVIIFIAGLILGNIVGNMSEVEKLNLKDEEIKSLTYSMESFKEDYRNCNSEKAGLILDYETKLENKDDLIFLLKKNCDIENDYKQERIPEYGYIINYYTKNNVNLVDKYYCIAVYGSDANYVAMKLYVNDNLAPGQYSSLDTSNPTGSCTYLYENYYLIKPIGVE